MFPTSMKKEATFKTKTEIQMIVKYTTKLGDRITRRISNRIIDTDGSLKNGYTLVLGLLIGFMIGASL